MKLYQIIKKNILTLVRSKSSALIILLGPLLIIFLVGLAFSNASTYNIRIGYYSSSYSNLSRSFADEMAVKYKTIEYKTQDRCLDDVKMGAIHACVIFPPDLKIDNDEKSEIVFYADDSRINLVQSVVNTVSDLIRSKSGKISSDLTEVLVTKIADTKQELNNKSVYLVQIKQRNDNLTASVSGVKTSLQNMDTSMSVDDFGLDSIQTAADSLRISAVLGINKTKTDLILANSTINNLYNVSETQKNAILSDINDSMNDLDALEASITSKTANDASDTETFAYQISQLQTKLTALQDKFNAIDSTRVGLYPKLDAVKKGLADDNADLTILQNSFDSIQTSLNSIEVTNVEKIINPVTIKVESVLKESKLNYLVPTLLVIVVMFVSILLSTTLVIMERNSLANFRNSITPTGGITFLLGTYITALIIISVQVLIMLAMNAYLYKVFFLPTQFEHLALVLFIIITMFVLIGMVIGYIFVSEETSTLAAVSVGSVCLFVSNLILPFESLPQYVIDVARYNPFVIADELVKKIYLFQTDISLITESLKILGIYCAALIVIMFIVKYIVEAEFFERSGASFFLFFRRMKKNRDKKKNAGKDAPRQADAKYVQRKEEHKLRKLQQDKKK